MRPKAFAALGQALCPEGWQELPQQPAQLLSSAGRAEALGEEVHEPQNGRAGVSDYQTASGDLCAPGKGSNREFQVRGERKGSWGLFPAQVFGGEKLFVCRGHTVVLIDVTEGS